jgi:hypothetical protein
MLRIVVCEKAGELENISSDSVVIIPHKSLISLFTQAKTESLLEIVDALRKISFESSYSNWFAIKASDIEDHQITRGLRAINARVRVFNEKIIDVALLQSLVDVGVIPVLII